MQPPITKLRSRDRAKRVSKIRKFMSDERDPFDCDGMPFATLFLVFRSTLFDLVLLYTWPVDATIQIKTAAPRLTFGDKLHDLRIIQRLTHTCIYTDTAFSRELRSYHLPIQDRKIFLAPPRIFEN